MTYRAHAAALAIELGTLAITGGSKHLSADGLDTALLGRGAVLSAARSTLATVTGRRPGPTHESWTASVHHLMDEPVINLQRELVDYPTPVAQMPLSERMKSPPTDPAERAWYDVAKHAELSRHDFSDLDPRLDDGHRWTVVADSAALARTIYVLDAQLLQAAERLGSPVAEALRETGTSPLPYVAEETLVVARSGALPDLDTIAKEDGTTVPVQFNGPAAAVEAQARLRRQLLVAEDISPEVIGITALTQARLLAGAVTILGPHDLNRAHLAADISDELRAVRANDPQLAALVPGDQWPRLQSHELLRYLDAAAQVDPSTTLGAHVRRSVAAVVDRAPGVVSALAEATDRQLSTHRWAVSYGGQDPDGPMWGIWTEDLEPPRLQIQLQQARAMSSPSLRSATFPPVPSYTPAPHPHEALAEVQRTRPRPQSPTRWHLGFDR